MNNFTLETEITTEDVTCLSYQFSYKIYNFHITSKNIQDLR